MNITRFALLVTAIAVGICLLSWYPLSTKMSSEELTLSFVAIGVSWLTSLIAYIIVFNGLENNPRMFMGYIMGGMMLKMFAGMIGIMAAGYFFEGSSIPYAVSFLISYLIFTSLEVVFLMKKARTT